MATLEQAKERLGWIAAEVRDTGDGYFGIYFSREQDKYARAVLGLDSLDLGVVVQNFYTAIIAQLEAHQPPAFVGYGMIAQIRDGCNKTLKLIEDEYATTTGDTGSAPEKVAESDE